MALTPSEPVYDPGLQPERTLLAWRRTALAIMVLSAIGLRFTVAEYGSVAIVLGAVGVGLGLISYLSTHIGYRRAHRQLTTQDVDFGNGWPQAFAATAALLLGCLALIYVL